MELRGRTVVLTGASGGIGSALCDELVEAGARVLAVGRSHPRLAALAARHPGGRVTPVVADLAQVDGRATVLAACGKAHPLPSLLILAHAQGGFGLFEQQSQAELHALLDTNLVAPMLLVRTLLPCLQAHPDGSAVVAIGSTFGSLAFPGFAAYSASKFGLRGLMEALGREHADGLLRFQYLAPRATRTAFNSPAADALNRELQSAVDEPAEVARALLAAIVRGDRRRQLGWPEKFLSRLNGAWPGLVDRSLRAKLPLIRRLARADVAVPVLSTAGDLP